jgi:UDP-N-acetylglucosamine 1-carboxyvinyltransferase
MFIVKGKVPLKGTVGISGSKNASLPVLAACLLTSSTCYISNLPLIKDVDTMLSIEQLLGADIQPTGCKKVKICANSLKSTEVTKDVGSKMRATILFMGPLLGRFGHVRVPKPGGDAIGMRRVEQHLLGFERMGATVWEEDGYYVAQANHGLKGAEIFLDMPTVTGTENLIMAACLAKGTTVINNAAREPHVRDLCRFLNALGARIRGAGSNRIVIEGVSELGAASHEVIPDYIEAGTYIMMAVASGEDVIVKDMRPDDLKHLLGKLEQAGACLEVHKTSVRVRKSKLRAVDITTWPHPGFATDLQPIYLALMTQAHGSAVVSEAVFEDRFKVVPELNKMGATIEIRGRSAIVYGPCELHGEEVVAPDIRSGASLVLASLCASGTTQIDGSYHIDRGYEKMDVKLASLGAEIERRSAPVDDELKWLALIG